MVPSHDGVWFITRLPWVAPSVALTLVLSIAGSGPIAAWLGVRRAVGWVLLMTTGVILAGTLTPLGPEYRADPSSDRSCDFSRIGLAGAADLTRPTDVLLNILMFIPLGFAIALAPWSPRKAALLAGATALPFLIELVQLVVSPIARGCQTADVTDNLTGLVIGFGAGTLAAWLMSAASRMGASDSP